MKQGLHHIILLLSLILAGDFNLSAQVDGKFYSLVYFGGNSSNKGTANLFDPLNNYDTALVIFTGPNGQYPYSNFIQLSDGMLYGTTARGGNGSPGNGTIIRYNIQTGQDTVLYKLPSDGSLGAQVYCTICHATNDSLYGLTYVGGSHNQGVLFSFNYHTCQYKVLSSLRGGAVGSEPVGSLIQASNGLLYGLTTNNPLPGALGTIFSYNIQTGNTLLLHTFTGNDVGYPVDGAYPRGTLLQVTDSMLYGLTLHGGTGTTGTLFSYNINTNVETMLISFTGPNGADPGGSLMQANDSNLYATTSTGGTYNLGTLFQYNIRTNTETVLHSFSGGDTDGASPWSNVIQATDSLLYGNTNLGGAYNQGAIFSYNIKTHTEKILLSYKDSLGEQPYADFLEAMSISVSVVNNHCPNDSLGSLTVNVRGGKTPFTYTWSNGATTSSITGLKSGIYSVIISDAKGITFSSSDTIKPLPMLLSFQVENPCSGSTQDSAVVFVSGGIAPFTYSWSNGQTTDTLFHVSPGTYTCNVTDAGGCPAKNTVVITSANTLTITNMVATNQTYPYNNGSITVYASGGIPPGDSVYYLYLWSNGAPNDSSTISNLDSGSYAVCVISPYGCGSTCDSAMVLTGTQNLNNPGNLVNVYPVPSSGLITIALSGDGFQSIEITDALGKQVYQQTLSPQLKDNTLHINLQNLTDGLYILRINSRQGFSAQKILIQK